MSATFVGSYSIGDINIALSGQVMPLLLTLHPLILNIGVQIDSLLLVLDLLCTAKLGLGGLKLDLALQFNATLSASLSLGIAVGNPILYYKGVLTAMATVVAGIQLALSVGLPTISVSLSAHLGAQLALAAALSAKIGGIQLLIDLALKAKTPALNFKESLKTPLLQLETLMAFLTAAMSVTGGIYVYTADGPAAASLGDLQTMVATHSGGSLIDPAVHAKSILIMVDFVANASAYGVLGHLLRIS